MPSLITNDRTTNSWCKPVQRDRKACCCTTIGGRPPDRPDLDIYSQEEQFSKGIAPTWDNPDILTNYWNPFRLMPEVSVTVRNISPSAAAVNALVSLYTSDFGLGMPQTMLSAATVNLAPSQGTTILFPLSQAILNSLDQRIGTYVRITHPSDRNLINNSGAQLLADAFTSKMGRAFSVAFPVKNPVSLTQAITLSTLPNALNAVIQPAVRNFSPLEQVVATLIITVPSGIHGTAALPVRQDVTVVAHDGGAKLIGGLTYVIWIDN